MKKISKIHKGVDEAALIICYKNFRKVFFKTVFNSIRKRSDKNRWSDISNLEKGWDERTALLAKWIKPNSIILEFGAGREILSNFLPNNCIYVSTDIIKRSEKMIECDLNAKELYNFSYHDVCFFSGVLEYVYDIPRLVSFLSNRCKYIIASYASIDVEDENILVFRRKFGWVNDYTSQEIISIFQKYGFRLEETKKWEKQNLFIFKNEKK